MSASRPRARERCTATGTRCVVERDAGARVGFDDAQYRQAGAQVVESGAVWACDLVVKVKEILPPEYPLLVAGTTIFGFAQINRDRALLDALRKARVAAIGYETVRDAQGRVPLLAPMSRIAGRLAPFAGADALSTSRGGSGVLLTGVDDVPGASVVVVGAGNVGGEAARVAARLGARVRVFSRGAPRRRALAESLAREGLDAAVIALDGDASFAEAVADADLVIGGVLEPGALSPKLISRGDGRCDARGLGHRRRRHRPGRHRRDIADDPDVRSDVRRVRRRALRSPQHAFARRAHRDTRADASPRSPYVRAMAARGIDAALAGDPGLAAGLMVRGGEIVHAGLAKDAA